MSSTSEQVKDFLAKCDEFYKCNFIMATTKIKDLLKCIVNNPELYKLFDTVTSGYDYPAQKAVCLVRADEWSHTKSQVILPQTIGQCLAFIFCLFVEFDHDTLSFNDFLRVFFNEGGNFNESYKAFCDVIIGRLAGLIKIVFKDDMGTEAVAPAPVTQVEGGLEKLQQASALNLAIEEEIQYVSENAPEDERASGIKILNALNSAIKEEDVERIDALICGYNYFILYNECVSDNVSALIKSIEDFENLL